jgi:hypothetical protein
MRSWGGRGGRGWEREERANATLDKCGAVTPSGLRGHAPDELAQAELQSSIRASQLGLAEGHFLYEVGISQHDRANLPNTNRWDEVGISQSARPTKHAHKE